MEVGRVAFVVQDLQSFMFLMPQDGAVGFTSALHDAGHFEGYEEAFETAVMVLGDGFKISRVWLLESQRLNTN